MPGTRLRHRNRPSPRLQTPKHVRTAAAHARVARPSCPGLTRASASAPVDSLLDGLDPQLCLAKMGQPSIRRRRPGRQGRHRGRRLCVHRTAARWQRWCSLIRKLQARGERYKCVGRMRMRQGGTQYTALTRSRVCGARPFPPPSFGAQRHIFQEVIASDLWPVPKYVLSSVALDSAACAVPGCACSPSSVRWSG